MSTVDVKALGKVAVLMGGSSAERPVSLMSRSEEHTSELQSH